MENWNNEEWQGRRKDQYESSAKIVVICAAITAVLAAIYLLTKLV